MSHVARFPEVLNYATVGAILPSAGVFDIIACPSLGNQPDALLGHET
jgi:hypothetical protein